MIGRPRVPDLEVALDIAATPDAVWRVLSDQRRMSTWSPETARQWFWRMPLRAGTISFNLNRRRWFVWPTVSRYRVVDPERELTFSVLGAAATWSYQLAPVAGGTRVVERRRLRGGRPSWGSMVAAPLFLGGLAEHDDELVAGMRTTLERIAAEATTA